MGIVEKATSAPVRERTEYLAKKGSDETCISVSVVYQGGWKKDENPDPWSNMDIYIINVKPVGDCPLPRGISERLFAENDKEYYRVLAQLEGSGYEKAPDPELPPEQRKRILALRNLSRHNNPNPV